ncbi:MAG: zeta toxin family protein [Deltaproteobacteria bacterium]|jgi:predicted ABC-type ATPase|nr:zeta toxin family protein [Deltaproteobacteria bacterium]
MSDEKKIVIIAGPNGAGKTTFAIEFLPNEADCPAFVNADLIAAGIAPFQPEKLAIRAGKLMLEEIKTHVLKGESFAFETTLSGRGYGCMIPEWQAIGYRVKLIFLSLPNVEMAIERVATRVAQGGHDVPEAIIKRRFEAGIRNFNKIYKSLVDAWILCDNLGEAPDMLEQGGKA